MVRLLALPALLLSFSALADCDVPFKLEGSIFVKTCEEGQPGCKPAAEVMFGYLSLPDNNPKVLSIGIQTSPWRFYDSEMRIQSPQELAAMLRPHLKPAIKRIELHGSWTGVAPEKGGKSLAKKLSEALDGFPVTGMDGFLWIAKDGSVRTTHQAFTLRKGGGLYSVTEGEDVMVALAAGWPAGLETQFAEQGMADAVMRAGAGYDIFALCPESALATFEEAARMSDAIGAYNAAMIRLERGKDDDKEAAIALLTKAVELGDRKADKKLKALQAATVNSPDPDKK